MRTLTIRVSPGNAAAGAQAPAPSAETISFDTVDALVRAISSRRWRILSALVEGSPLGVSAIAQRIGHDPKTVHLDVQALVRAGIVGQNDRGHVTFPFDAVHVEFTIGARLPR